MPIPAQRFDFLSEETNVATSDFYSQGSAILNDKAQDLQELSADMHEFIQNAVQSSYEELDEMLKNAVSEVQSVSQVSKDTIREARSLFGSVRDLARDAPKQLEKAVGSLLPNNPIVQSMFKTMSSRCKQNAFGRGGLGKPYDTSVNCGGKSRKAGSNGCDTGQFSNILNALSGGAYNSAFNDANSTLAAIMALGMYGYKMNMCGVFGALASAVGQNPNLLSRAAGGLINGLSEDGNVLGILDLSNASAVLGLHALVENPGGIGKIVSGFKMPGEIGEMLSTGVDGLTERFQGALELFKPDMTQSLIDGVPSIEDFGDNYNPDLTALYQMDTGTRGFSLDDLDSPPSFNYKDYVSTSYERHSDGIVF